MTHRIPTDDELRELASCDFTPLNMRSVLHAIATELLEHRTAELARRAAASEGFAAGDVVTANGYAGEWVVTDYLVITSPIAQRTNQRVMIEPRYLTRVPPAPTAIEVFAEAWLRACGDERSSGSITAFREFCRVAGIAADEPLGGAR